MKPIDKDILKINQLYETILNDTKKRFVNEVMLVPINQKDYPNITTDSDTRFDQVNKSLLDDIQSVAKSMGVTVKITTASSGHSSKTTSGNLSRHPSGQAVDISFFNNYGSPGAKSANEVESNFKSLADSFVSKLTSMGYSRNSEGGNPKSVLWFFNDTDKGGNHFNHVHVSNTTTSSSIRSKGNDSEPDTDSGTSNNLNNDFSSLGNSNDSILYNLALGLAKDFGVGESVKIKSQNDKIIEDIKKIKNLLK